jgi:hypothetical protein
MLGQREKQKDGEYRCCTKNKRRERRDEHVSYSAQIER